MLLNAYLPLGGGATISVILAVILMFWTGPRLGKKSSFAAVVGSAATKFHWELRHRENPIGLGFLVDLGDKPPSCVRSPIVRLTIFGAIATPPVDTPNKTLGGLPHPGVFPQYYEQC